MDVIAPESLRILSLPLVVIGVDPDSDHTAIAVLTREPSSLAFSCATIDGGGRGRVASPWGDVLGATAEIGRWLAYAGKAKRAGAEDPEGEPTRDVGRVVVGVESQLASGGAHSSDVEGCRRARWHWDAACTTLAVRCLHVDPGAWQPRIGADGRPLAIEGVKREYRRLALALDPRATNEDRAAALGVAAYVVRLLGGEVVPSKAAKS